MIGKGRNSKDNSRLPPKASRRRGAPGQVIIEFTFCLIIVLLMIYGVTKVFFWAGRDLVERRKAHDELLISGGSPPQQIAPDFYTPVKMNAIWVNK
jgi:hypothetical protein